MAVYYNEMFKKGQGIIELMSTLEKQTIKKYIVQDKIHDSDEIEFVQDFINRMKYCPTIPMSDMISMVTNKTLAQTPFQIMKITKKEI